MPTYCYQCEGGHSWEVSRRIADRRRPDEANCPQCGSKAVRDFKTEMAAPPPPGCYADQGYLWSDSAGVSSGRLAAEQKRFPHHVFRRTEEGTYQRGFRNAAHRRSCMKELGLVDKRSFI